MSKYYCHFVLKDAVGGPDSHMVAVSEQGPSAFAGGFWLTEKYQFTTGLDNVYWIPPHCIKFIRVERAAARTIPE